MSATAVNGLVLLITAFLLASSVVAVVWLPPGRLVFEPEATQALSKLASQFEKDLWREAAQSPRAVKRKKVVKRDIKAEYRKRRKWPRKLLILRSAAGGITFGVVGFVVALLALPFLAGPFPVVAGTAGYAGAPLAALGLVVAATKFVDKPDDGPDTSRAQPGRQRSGPPSGLPDEPPKPVAQAMERYRARATRAARKRPLSTACRKRGQTTGISKEEIPEAWEFVGALARGLPGVGRQVARRVDCVSCGGAGRSSADLSHLRASHS